MHVAEHIGKLALSERSLAAALESVAVAHADEPDVRESCKLFAKWSNAHIEALKSFQQKYGEQYPEQLSTNFGGPRKGPYGLLQDLGDLLALVQQTRLAWMLLNLAGMGLRDKEIERACKNLGGETGRQLNWLETRIEDAATQTLVAAS
jgi:hypothetical protein